MSRKTTWVHLMTLCALFALTTAAYAGVGAKIETQQTQLCLVAWNSDWLPAEGRDCYVEVRKRTRLAKGTMTRWEKMKFTFHDGGAAKSVFKTFLGPAGTTEAEVVGYGFK